jgi:hypothetical protein
MKKTLLTFIVAMMCFSLSLTDDGKLGHGRGDRGNSGGQSKQTGGERNKGNENRGSGQQLQERNRGQEQNRNQNQNRGKEQDLNRSKDQGKNKEQDLNRGKDQNQNREQVQNRNRGQDGSAGFQNREQNRERKNEQNWNSNLGKQVQRERVIIRTPQIKNIIHRDRYTYRTGYYHYKPEWHNSLFRFNFYLYEPDYDRCVVSPWYCYPHLPGYIRINNVLILTRPRIVFWVNIDDRGCYWRDADLYDWRYELSRANGTALDDALDTLVYAFEKQNKRSISRLIPDRTRINVYSNEEYSYSLQPDDFYDLMIDNIENTQTVRYDVVSVRNYRAREARVLVRHEFIDPWNERQTMYHTYRLELQKGQYIITDFGTSDYRPRF